MPRFITAAALALAGALAACSPTLNWREVAAAPTPLKAMLPCKPDKAERDLPILGQPVHMQALGCEAGGASFAIVYGDIGNAGRAGEALAQWKAASLANVHAAAGEEKAFVPAGALAVPQSVRVSASGQRPGGGKVKSEAAYFARGSYVFQAVIYADAIPAEAAQPFFSGLRFQ